MSQQAVLRICERSNDINRLHSVKQSSLGWQTITVKCELRRSRNLSLYILCANREYCFINIPISYELKGYQIFNIILIKLNCSIYKCNCSEFFPLIVYGGIYRQYLKFEPGIKLIPSCKTNKAYYTKATQVIAFSIVLVVLIVFPVYNLQLIALNENTINIFFLGARRCR